MDPSLPYQAVLSPRPAEHLEDLLALHPTLLDEAHDNPDVLHDPRLERALLALRSRSLVPRVHRRRGARAIVPLLLRLRAPVDPGPLAAFLSKLGCGRQPGPALLRRIARRLFAPAAGAAAARRFTRPSGGRSGSFLPPPAAARCGLRHAPALWPAGGVPLLLLPPPTLRLPARRAVVCRAALARAALAMGVRAAKRTPEVLASRVARIGEEKDPAVPAAREVPPELRPPGKNRAQDEVVLERQSAYRLPSIPPARELEGTLEFYEQNPSVSLMMLILFFSMLSSYHPATNSSRVGRELFFLGAPSRSAPPPLPDPASAPRAGPFRRREDPGGK